MFPVTVQFIVAMLAYALNERMARRLEARGRRWAAGSAASAAGLSGAAAAAELVLREPAMAAQRVREALAES